MRLFKKKKDKKDKNAVTGLPPDMVYSMEPRQGHGQDVYDENGIRQVAGCLPIDPINKRFLLVSSSSNNGTWVIPKGGWEKDETQQQAAMRETWEEAGVKGVITRHVGVFAEKHKGEIKAHHWIYEMEIKEVTKKFPEQKKRERRWFSYDEAMLVVKASYIHDALSMSSLSRLAHPQCDSLTGSPNGDTTEKKKKKKKKVVEDDSDDDSERERERKKEKKKEKKKKAKENNDSEAAESVGDNSEEEEGEKKKKKKKKNKKGGEIIELNEDELPPMKSTQPQPLVLDEKALAPITQQLNQTHITSAPYPNVPIIPQQQFRPAAPPPSQSQQPRSPPPPQQSPPQQHYGVPPRPQQPPLPQQPQQQQQQQQQPRSPPLRHPQQQHYQRPPPPSQHPYQQQRMQQQQQQQQQQQPQFPHHHLFPQQPPYPSPQQQNGNNYPQPQRPYPPQPRPFHP